MMVDMVIKLKWSILKGGYLLNARDLGLSGECAMHWEPYIEIVKEAWVRFKVENDKLVWVENKKNDIITAKLAYEFMAKNWSKAEQRWWYKNLWKWNIPQKLKCSSGYLLKIRS